MIFKYHTAYQYNQTPRGYRRGNVTFCPRIKTEKCSRHRVRYGSKLIISEETYVYKLCRAKMKWLIAYSIFTPPYIIPSIGGFAMFEQVL